MDQFSADAVIVGAGPAGLAAAVALAAAGARTTIVGTPASDHRTTALLASSVAALDTLGVWRHCRDHAAPLRSLRIVDATNRLWRAPEVRFDCAEVDLDAFGWNVENHRLVDALLRRAREMDGLQYCSGDAKQVQPGERDVAVVLQAGGAISARLAVGADGRHSLCRAAAGIATGKRRYPQVALIFNLAHGRPHHDTSTEFHTGQGPFTLVPLIGNRSSLVWVTTPREADRIEALDDAALALEIERQAHSILGKISLEPGRGRFALAAETAKQFAAGRIVLVGEAAHTLPPIGAQGFNLGLRDAATIAELVAQAMRDGADPGGPDIIETYDRRRRADVTTRTMAVDLLNRILLSDFLPAQAARGLGLYLLDQVGPLRRAVMREGVAPSTSLPRLMQGELL